MLFNPVPARLVVPLSLVLCLVLLVFQHAFMGIFRVGGNAFWNWGQLDARTQEPPRGQFRIAGRCVRTIFLVSFVSATNAFKLCDHGLPRMFWNIELM